MILIPFIFTSCSKEESSFIDPEREIFNFLVTESQRIYINSSRGEQYEVTDPVPVLEYAEEKYTIDRFEIRGDNTLNFERKGYGINMNRKIVFYNADNQTERKYEEFKLLAMVYDYTYIENSTAINLFKEIGLWPVLTFYTEVRLNNFTQGLYLFIEDPFEYFIEQENSSFVIRRGYDHVIKASSASPLALANSSWYISLFRSIYSNLPLYSGKQMFDTLSAAMDLDQYFTKLSIDMLMKNGDYTDEVIFYTKIRDGKEVFGVFPWDLDDIFAEEPHEIGNSWAPGTVFGSRQYNTIEDVIADVGVKLLFSIEDDLDYKIAKDDYLYQQYLITLRRVIDKIDPQVIDNIFDNTFNHISPFYSNDSIIAQSRYDIDETNYNLFLTNLASKKQMLKERRNWIIQELDLQQKNRYESQTPVY
jgi:hypothetical protein